MGLFDIFFGSKEEPSDERSDIEELEAQIRRITAQRDKFEKDLDDRRRQRDQLSRECDGLRVERKQLQIRLSNTEQELRRNQQEYQQLYAQHESAKAEIQHFVRANDFLEKQLGEKDVLLETRRAELTALQAFVPRTDSLSTQDVRKEVEGLNDEILQVASILAETAEAQPRQLPSSDHQQLDPIIISARDILRQDNILSKGFLETLFSSGSDAIGFLLQTALQAYIVAFCVQMGRTFHIPEDPVLQTFLGGIRAAEPYPVYSKWKAVTHAQGRRQLNGNIIHSFANNISHILIASGWSQASSPEYHNQLAMRLDVLVKTAVEVGVILMQKVLTLDAELLAPASGQHFDEASMVSDMKNPNGEILCSVSLGLMMRNPGDEVPSVALKAAVCMPEELL